MDPIAILQNRIEQLEAKLGVAGSQQGGDSRDSVAANLMNAHAAMASGAAGHEKVSAAMAQATELNNYTSPDVMQHMQQRQMQMHEVAAAEPAIRQHCHCMHHCKMAAPALESDVIAQVPQMQATLDHMKADIASIKSDADAQSQLNSPRPNIQDNRNAQMPVGMPPQRPMQGNPNTMNVYQATVHNNTPFQEHPNAMQGNPPAQVDPNAMHANPNQMRGNTNVRANPNAVPNEWQRNRLSMFGGHDVASAMRGNPNESIAVHGTDIHGNPKVTHENSNVMHGGRNVVPNEMHGNPHMVHGNEVVAGHASVPYAQPHAMSHAEHVHANTMPNVQNAHHNGMSHEGHAEHVHANAMPNVQNAHHNGMSHEGHAEHVHANGMLHAEHVHANAMPNVQHAHHNAIPYAEHVHPNAMPNSGHAYPNSCLPHQMVHGSHEPHAAHENGTLSGHVANQTAQPASPRSPVPEVTQGIQQLAESCGATAGLASEQLANVTQKVEQAEQRKFQRRNGLD